MDVLVCLKRVPLAGGTLILTPDSRDIETKHLGFGISPHEENAVEAGVQLVEQMGGTLTLLTLGPSDAEEQLRSQLAIGATRSVLIETDGQEWDPWELLLHSLMPLMPKRPSLISLFSVQNLLIVRDIKSIFVLHMHSIVRLSPTLNQ